MKQSRAKLRQMATPLPDYEIQAREERIREVLQKVRRRLRKGGQG